VDTVKGAGRGH